LVIAEVDRDHVEATVNALRLAATPALFVVRPSVPQSGADGLKSSPSKRLDPGATTRRSIVEHLERNKQALESARSSLMEAARLEHALTPAAEWILDNSYLVHT